MRALLVIAIASTAVGCSSMVEFIVTNGSSVPLRVTYSVSPTGESPACWLDPSGYSPRILLGRERGSRVQTELSASEFEFDAKQCSIALTLAPGTSVVIDGALNYRGHRMSSRDTRRLARYRVTLVSQTGELSCSGLEFVRRLHRTSDDFYELEYVPPEFALASRP